MSEKGVGLLLGAARELGIELEPYLDQFLLLYQRLMEANQITNLTAIRDEAGVILKHFVDSLSCLKSEKLSGELKVVDVGTGAGFPGLPLKIVKRELEMSFLDATKKKIEFIEGVCRELGLSNTHCIWGRAEELGWKTGHREAYDRVLSRAVASLDTLSELCLPLVKVGGIMIVQKGPGVRNELNRARGAIRTLGGALADVITFDLPVLGEPRSLVIIEKIQTTPPGFPRRVGVPAKNPLS